MRNWIVFMAAVCMLSLIALAGCGGGVDLADGEEVEASVDESASTADVAQLEQAATAYYWRAVSIASSCSGYCSCPYRQNLPLINTRCSPAGAKKLASYAYRTETGDHCVTFNLRCQ